MPNGNQDSPISFFTIGAIILFIGWLILMWHEGRLPTFG